MGVDLARYATAAPRARTTHPKKTHRRRQMIVRMLVEGRSPPAAPSASGTRAAAPAAETSRPSSSTRLANERFSSIFLLLPAYLLAPQPVACFEVGLRPRTLNPTFSQGSSAQLRTGVTPRQADKFAQPRRDDNFGNP